MVIDKLYERVEKTGHVCLGLDTDFDYIPLNFADNFSSKGEAIFEFNKKIIDATRDIVACYKVQIAYYEALGVEGMIAFRNTLKYIRQNRNIVISDVKRGDIAKTAEMYARAHFEGDFETDFVTINAYMGMDTLEPFFPYIKEHGKGLFALIRTSNRGAPDIQNFLGKDGEKLYTHMGRKIQDMGSHFRGQCGYSSIGGVVGCTHIEEGIELRKELGSTFFLIPGYGAQGGGAKEVAVYLKSGNGGIVNSSRGILLAYKKQNRSEEFEICAREETERMREDILKIVKG